MRLIKKQFGAEFAEALAKCPTLVADLQEIRQQGVKIRKVGGHCQAYSIAHKKTIYIGSNCALSYQLISLSHEKVHVLTNPTVAPLPGRTSRKAFIDGCLNAETDCIVHEVVVVGELIAAGYKVDDHSMGWYKLYKRGGRDAIRKAIEQATTSNTGEKYPEYYGAWYDEVLKPKDRVPFHQLHGKQSRGRIKLTLPHIPSVVAPRLTVGKGGRDLCPRFCSSCESETPVRVVLPTTDGRQQYEETMKSRSKCPSLRMAMMPRDTNGMGNIFGGVILSHIDIAGAVAARAICSNRVVTVCMKEVVFKKPVHVNDVLTCWAEVIKVGKTSITTRVEVEVERNGEIIPVTEATAVYVSVDEDGNPTPVTLHKKKRCSGGCRRTGKSGKRTGKSSR